MATLGQGHYKDIGNDPDEMGDNLTPVDLGTGRTAKQIALGMFSTCAILNDDKVKCWGATHDGNIGDQPGEMGDALPVINLGDNYSAKQISLMYAHRCVILDDNTVKCWGINYGGQLGQENNKHLGYNSIEMGNNLNKVEF